MTSNPTPPPPAWPMIRRLLTLAGPGRRWLFAALALDLMGAALLILGNHFNRGFFEAVTAGDAQAFWVYVGLAIGSSAATAPLSYLRVRGIGQFAEGTLARLRSAIASRSAALPVGALEQRHTGDLVSVLNADLEKLKLLLASHLLELVGQSVRALAAFAYIVSVNWVLALAATILTPLIFVAISVLSAPIGKRSEELQTDIGRVVGVAQDGLSGIMVVKAFNLNGPLGARFDEANASALRKGLGIARLRALIEGVTLPMAITPFILAIGLGGYFVIEGTITFGALFAFINLLNFVVNPLGAIPNILAGVQESAAAARRVFDLLDQPAERADGIVSTPAREAGPALAIERLTFAFPEADRPVVNNVSFTVPSGQTVALVGPSGSGKSTLLKLILGYYPTPPGSIHLLGHDLNDWRLSAARDQLALVAQDTYLFPVSLGENIRLGRPEATPAEVERAARLANIHDFIAALPDGYATLAGERGARLSGGQRQRIALARAILKDAPILLLDEPTSALDTESESLVQQALETYSRGRTTLVIAHRLSTIKNADHVVVLEDGAVVEQGTHDALLARGGLYLDLYRRQFNGTNGEASHA